MVEYSPLFVIIRMKARSCNVVDVTKTEPIVGATYVPGEDVIPESDGLPRTVTRVEKRNSEDVYVVHYTTADGTGWESSNRWERWIGETAARPVHPREFVLSSSVTGRVNLATSSAGTLAKLLDKAVRLGASHETGEQPVLSGPELAALFCTDYRGFHADALKAAYTAGRRHIKVMGT
jgi:hypothetical protein